MSIRRYNARRHVHRLYCGVNRDAKTMTVSAYSKKEAKDEMRKKGFSPVKVYQT